MPPCGFSGWAGASHTWVNNHHWLPARWDASLLWWPPANSLIVVFGRTILCIFCTVICWKQNYLPAIVSRLNHNQRSIIHTSDTSMSWRFYENAQWHFFVCFRSCCANKQTSESGVLYGIFTLYSINILEVRILQFVRGRYTVNILKVYNVKMVSSLQKHLKSMNPTNCIESLRHKHFGSMNSTNFVGSLLHKHFKIMNSTNCTGPSPHKHFESMNSTFCSGTMLHKHVENISCATFHNTREAAIFLAISSVILNDMI